MDTLVICEFSTLNNWIYFVFFYIFIFEAEKCKLFHPHMIFVLRCSLHIF